MRSLSILLATILLALRSVATGFFLPSYNGDGTLNTNTVFASPWPPSDTPYVVIGTNIVFQGTYPLSPNASNWLYAGVWKFAPTNTGGSSYIVNLLDTTNYGSVSIYITNASVLPGIALSGFQVITQLCGFTPANAATIGTIASRGSNDFLTAIQFTNAPVMTFDNPTNSYTVNTLYTNGLYASTLVGWASGATLFYTNGGVGYFVSVTNDFSVPLSTNATFKFSNTGTVSNVVNWARRLN